MRWTRSAVAAAAGLLLVAGGPAAAQATTPPAYQLPSEQQRTYVAMNMVLGAARAGVAAHRAHRPVMPAALRGAAAGVAIAAGIRLVGESGAARLPGHLLTAVGASAVRNAGAGVPVLDDILVPLPPFYLRVRPRGEDRVQVQVSAAGAAVATALYVGGYGVVRVDWAETLASGGLSFRSDLGGILDNGLPSPASCSGSTACPRTVRAKAIYGILVYGDEAADDWARISGHENVHRAQFTRDMSMTAPEISTVVYRRLFGRHAPAVARWVVFDLVGPMRLVNELSAVVSGGGIGSGNNLYEREAELMTGRYFCRGRPTVPCRW